jgi:hypothetical protein
MDGASLGAAPDSGHTTHGVRHDAGPTLAGHGRLDADGSPMQPQERSMARTYTAPAPLPGAAPFSWQDRRRWAWQLEGDRPRQAGRSPWSVHNSMLQSHAATLLLQGSLVAAFGWVMLPFLAVHYRVAWWQLNSANCAEHYGPLRRRSSGTGVHEGGTGCEAPQPHHS